MCSLSFPAEQSEVEEPRCVTGNSATGSFDLARDDGERLRLPNKIEGFTS
jgi:hypothetical protein